MTGPTSDREGGRPRAASVRRAGADVLGLVLPVECPGCGRWDVPLCGVCASLFDGPLRRCEDSLPALAGPGPAGRSEPGPSAGSDPPGRSLPVWTLAAYAGPVRGVVLAWKNRGGRPVAEAVTAAGRRAGTAWAELLVAEGTAADAGIGVVPAPSGRRRRRTGRFVVGKLAAAVAEGLVAGGLRPVVVADVLRRRAGRAHQGGLGLVGRSRNRRHSMRLAAPPPDGAVCVLVDDVVTTGATLAECARVVAAAGGRVAGALVLAATPPPGRHA